MEGDSPVLCLDTNAYGALPTSRVAWDCSTNGW